MAKSRPTPSVALVTGASRGIGREVALRLAARGLSIGVHYRASREQAEDVVRQIRSVGVHAYPFAADLADSSQTVDLVSSVESELGPLAVLVNNAGMTRDRLLLQLSVDDWEATWRTNLVGPRIVARAALSSMMERRSGRIVNVSSVVGVTGNPGQANYAAAKSAVHGLTRELALRAAPAGVTVNCVIPGYITTDATSHLTEEQQEAWLRRIPMGRAAGPGEVADSIVFLTLDASAYITGQCLAVDGGLLAAVGAGLAS